MGNYLCIARRRPVEERLTRPQRQILRQPPDFDLEKLRKLIRSHKLAPCFDALDEPHHHLPDLEECPICFFYFPSLNRSSCCSKGICTECFLQMLPPDATRSVRCPFCKTSCYAVEYRGAKTKQEKDLEQVEEQKVIEAKIRMQDQFQSVEEVLPSGNTQSIFEAHYPFMNLRRRPGDGSSISSLQHQVFHDSDPKLRKGFNGT